MLWPFILTILFREISFLSILKALSSLSKTNSTYASRAGLIYLEPMKTKLRAFSARIDFIDNLPNTKQIASEILDFPDPFGPIITLIPLSNGISVFLANDLKP